MTPPTTIQILSDGNELSFKEIIKPTNGKGETQYIYQYTKPISKKNQLLGLNENELLSLIKTNLP